MRIVVDSRDFSTKGLVVNFKGVTTYGEEISLNATYDRDLKMVGCSSAYSSMNNAKYYVEVAEYFKSMLELEESEKLKDTFKQVEDIEKKYDNEKEALYEELNMVISNIGEVDNELSSMNKVAFELNSQIEQLEKSLKRCVKQDSIKDRQKAIEGLKKKIDAIEITNRKDRLKRNLISLKRDIIKIEKKIENNWRECDIKIKIEIVNTKAIESKNTIVLNAIEDVSILDDIFNNIDNRDYIRDLVKDVFDGDIEDEEYELEECFLNRWNYTPNSVLVDLDSYKIIEI